MLPLKEGVTPRSYTASGLSSLGDNVNSVPSQLGVMPKS